VSSTTTYRIGCLNVLLRGIDFPLAEGGTRFDLFETAADPDIEIAFAVGDSPRPDYLVLERRILPVVPGTGIIEFEGSYWSARFDLAGATATARLPGPWVRSVDSLVSTAIQLYAPALGAGVLFHGSAVERDGGAYVFLGRSGAGKTTSAFLMRGDGATVLAEELTFVGDFRSGGGLCVYTLPMFQRDGTVVDGRIVPLRGMYALHQAPTHEVRRPSLDAQMRSLLSSVTIGVRTAVTAVPTYDLLCELARRAPVRELRFRKDAGFWPKIRDDLA